ncbi:hypothetical protein M404DRAFT_992660 [Pisolithus tinctorius Marx 270]|uniref:Uncharacterized protein n=1 Tax=Pisolithus tinctorius Marx 270 TaxID=870435 RepID=A0A0C3KY28_PISTI|nr:hypothetical protein M404DRAFT_992660 [Pisolithus tinctorius Marx 270]
MLVSNPRDRVGGGDDLIMFHTNHDSVIPLCRTTAFFERCSGSLGGYEGRRVRNVYAINRIP